MTQSLGVRVTTLLMVVRGNDTLNGDAGSDTFVIAPIPGTDTIADFELGNDLLGLSTGISFSDLSFVDSNIVFNDRALVSLTEIDATSLSENNFVSVLVLPI